jgi:hypothetical protein
MRIILFIAIVILSISSCTHKITRSGYDINKTYYKTCDIVVTKKIAPSDSLQRLGSIRLGDTGFSASCNEAQAIEILKNEGCAIGANIVHITEESRADVLSSCYRCSAVFYKSATTASANQSDAHFDSKKVNDRVNEDRGRTTTLVVVSVVIGVIVGFLMVQ